MHEQPAARRSGPRRRGAAIWAGLTVAAMSLVAAVLSLSVRPGWDDAVRFSGFAIDQVSITGHRFTPDAHIYAALDLDNVRSVFNFDAASVRKRFERLAWVQSAEISRVWPNLLDIRITERKAFAVWGRGEDDFLIDAAGRVLQPIKRGSTTGLPRVSGEGADQQAQELLATLKRFPGVAARVVEAERVGDRRWTLHLKDDVTVHLPPDQEASVLAELDRGGVLASTISSGSRIVDLRAPGRIAVRPDAGKAAAMRALLTFGQM